MPPFDSLLVITAGALAGLALVTAAAAWGWARWLAVKRLEFAGAPAEPSAMGRIEVADLKERVRKLEAIAAGVDL